MKFDPRKGCAALAFAMAVISIVFSTVVLPNINSSSSRLVRTNNIDMPDNQPHHTNNDIMTAPDAQRPDNLPRNKSLVIAFGELRGGEQTWKTLYDNVLDVNSADLAVFTSSEIDYTNNSLIERAKFVWYHDEYEDWADAIDTINGTSWRTTHLPHFHDWNVYSYPTRNQSILFGGIARHPCDPLTAGVSYCEHRGSGIIVFMQRYWLMNHIREEVLPLQQYERIVVSRADNFYECMHNFTDFNLENNTIWVPTGEEYGGFCDRHLVAGKANILDALDIMRELTHKPYHWDYEKHHNTERFMKHAWKQKRLKVEQFQRVMFTVKTSDDTTRWQTGQDTELPSNPGLFVKYKREWYGAQNGCARQNRKQSGSVSSSLVRRKFTIVILTMNRLHSLQRLVKSLSHPDCQYGHFRMPVHLEFHIDRPQNDADEPSWLDTLNWVENNMKGRWPFGNVVTLVARKNMELRDAWFSAWTPENDYDRAIILEDDVEVSPLWFQWVNGAYDAYASNSNIAGFSLQRQDLVPLKDCAKRKERMPTNNNEPFLYSLPGSIGFAPNPRVWKDFIEWTKCALCNNVDVSVDSLITTNWWRKYNKKSMWTQHFIYYIYQNNLYCLYHFPKNESQALALHWKEKGEHYKNKATDPGHSKVTDPGQMGNFAFLEKPNRYDWGANLLMKLPRTLLLSAAVGYNDLSMFSTFLTTLRRHYQDDAMLLIKEGAQSEIKTLIQKYNVMHEEVNGTDDWNRFNIDRFKFYSKYCKSYDRCMVLDFRDSFFQDNPFKSLKIAEDEELAVQTHRIRFGDNRKGIPLHMKMIPVCANHNLTLAEEYKACLMGKPLINAGGIIGKWSAFAKLESLVLEMAKEDCTDQMAVNIGVYCHLHNLTSVKVFDQGTGPINTLGYGSFWLKLGSKISNRDCLPSPVVHQGDLVNLTGPAPLGGVCMKEEFEKHTLPGGGYELVKTTKPVQTTGESQFQTGEEVQQLYLTAEPRQSKNHLLDSK